MVEATIAVGIDCVGILVYEMNYDPVFSIFHLDKKIEKAGRMANDQTTNRHLF